MPPSTAESATTTSSTLTTTAHNQHQHHHHHHSHHNHAHSSSPSPSSVSVTRAFALWGLFAAVYYAFELGFIETPHDLWYSFVLPYTSEPEATWALVSHLAGFTFFMVLMTRQSRWLWITAIGGGGFLWVCKAVGVPQGWWLFTTNTFGLALMIISLVMGLGVFSSLYLFSHLISFVKKGAKRYPGLAIDLRRHPLLKIVIPEDHLRLPTDNRQGNRRLSTHECFLCKSAASSVVPVCNAWKGERIPNGTGDARLVCAKFNEVREQRDSAVHELAALKQKLQAFEAALQASRVDADDQRQLAHRYHTDLIAAKAEADLLRQRIPVDSPVRMSRVGFTAV